MSPMPQQQQQTNGRGRSSFGGWQQSTYDSPARYHNNRSSYPTNNYKNSTKSFSHSTMNGIKKGDSPPSESPATATKFVESESRDATSEVAAAVVVNMVEDLSIS
jgi:hypothetical protein